LEKNYFAKAEFFLLTLASYDSAAAGYFSFIQTSEDSLLVPKAQYALYYIYAYELNFQHEADSIKQIILDDYPLSSYAAFFTAKDNIIENEEEKESPYKYLYFQGEAMMSDSRYPEAIDFFNQIAEEDSGSDLAQKARYATAWIYENKLEDSENAVTAYSVLAREYPDTEAGEIARNKIKIPVQEEIETPSANQDSTLSNESGNFSPTFDDEPDSTNQQNDSQVQEEPQIPDNPDDQ